MKRMKLDNAHTTKLIAIYHALSGMCSEIEDPMHGMYRGRDGKSATETMMTDFEDILRYVGVEVVEPKYTPVEYEFKDPCTGKPTGIMKWGILSDPNDPKSYVLSGLESREEAEEVIRKFCA